VSGGEGWDHGDGPQDRPFGARPFGARPYGVRPFGARPFGARPFGARSEEEEERPFGARPFGARPYGARPFGARPYGARPYGARPFGARPFGARQGFHDFLIGALDPEEWSADIADLFCERSAVIRLGATVVFDEYEIRVPAVDATGNAPAYLEEEGEEKRVLKRREVTLRPRDHELAAKVVLPDRVARDIAHDPVLALAVKEDLAEALALRADQAFLQGAAPAPVGISNLVAATPAGADPLVAARALATAKRTVDPLLNPTFRAPGWVIHPATLDALTRVQPGPAGTSVDMYLGLLSPDGTDGGHLLGYPFFVSAAASVGNARALFFSADWREAWIGADGTLVNVEISTDAHFQTDETVIRATMCHDFTLRRPEAFAWSRGAALAAAARARRSSSGSTARSRSRRSSG
jgi:HK97 family phage major capsid protein